MPYARQQEECEARFENIAKEASLRRSDADDWRNDGGDGARQLAATNSTIRAQVYAMEYAALEVHKRDPATRKGLTPGAEKAFQELGFKLDEHIQTGPEHVEKRRAALLQALDHPAGGMPGNAAHLNQLNYSAMANTLNTQAASRRPALPMEDWQAADLAKAVGHVHQMIGREDGRVHDVFVSQQRAIFRGITNNREERAEEIEALNERIQDDAPGEILQHLPQVAAARGEMREREFDQALRHEEMQVNQNDADHDDAMSMDSHVSESSIEPQLHERMRTRDGRGL